MTKVTLLGDSITFMLGNPLSTSLGPAAATWVNAGVSGNTTYDALVRVDADVPADSTHCVIHLGINDIGNGVGGLAADVLMPGTSTNHYTSIAGYIAQIVACIENRHIVPVLATLLPTTAASADAANRRTQMLSFNAWLTAYAAAKGLLVVDYYPAFLNGSYGDPTYYSPDGIHPNASGRTVQAAVLLEAMVGNPQYVLRGVYRDVPITGATLVAYETVDVSTPRVLNWTLVAGSPGYTGTGMTNAQIDTCARVQAGL